MNNNAYVKKAGGLSVIVLLLFGVWCTGPVNFTGNYAFGQVASSSKPVQTSTTTTSTQSNLPNITIDTSATPMQKEIKDSLANLIKTGKSHPKATYSVNVTRVGDLVTVMGVTTLDYASPSDAGLTKWPSFIIKKGPNLQGTGTIKEGNYTNYVIEKAPQIFGPGKAIFGHEARRTIIVETLQAHTSLQTTVTPFPKIAPHHSPLAKNVLMGFSIPPQNIDWTIAATSQSCTYVVFFGNTCVTWYDFKAGFQLAYGLGMRLPATVSITGPNSMVASTTSTLKTTLTPKNFNSADYQAVGVQSNELYNGDEFIANENVFLGITLSSFGQPLINWAIASDIDLASDCGCPNFITPFGKDTNGNQKVFPIHPITLDSTQTNLKLNVYGADIGFGIQLQPLLGSNKITATWTTGGNSVPHSGTVTYTDDPTTTPSTLAPTISVTSGHATTPATLSIDQFTYYFNQFQIAISANVQFGGIVSFVPATSYYPLYTLNLGNTGLKLGQHAGTAGITYNIPVIPACPIGYVYDASKQTCVLHQSTTSSSTAMTPQLLAPTTPDTPQCKPGFTLNASKQMCVPNPSTTKSLSSMPTATTTSVSSNPSAFGQMVTFTATVTTSSGSSTPTGTVQFMIDGIVTLPVKISTGHAVISISTLSVGSHGITATYSGDTNYGPSKSSSLTQTVNEVATVTTQSVSPSNASPSKPQCDTGYSYDSSKQTCVQNPTDSSSSSSTTLQCQRGYSYDTSKQICVKSP